jgi:hypothetical protein
VLGQTSVIFDDAEATLGEVQLMHAIDA